MKPKANKKDILVFLSDQHHRGYAGYAGNRVVRTPNLDALANTGTVFDSAYTACPLCVPSRCAFLTGRLPSESGLFTNADAIPSDQTTFLHSLGAAGYETVLCGRMHFMGDDQRHGFTRRIMGEYTPLYWGRYGRSRTDLGPYVMTAGNEFMNVVGGGNSPVLEYDRAVIRAAVEYLADEHAKPQCIVVGTYGPHHTYVAPDELYRYYREASDSPRPWDADGYHHPVLEQRRRADLSPDDFGRLRAAYYGMIEHLDTCVGEVMESWGRFLERRGNDGLFVYLSDHGDLAGEHRMQGKEMFYEGSAGIPLVVSGAGIPRNARVSEPASILDVGATLCELADAPPLPDLDGRSLVEVISSGEESEDRVVLSESVIGFDGSTPVPGRMVRRGCWKLVHYAGFDEYDLLFDLIRDPLETVNCAAEEPAVLAEFRRYVRPDSWNDRQILDEHLMRQKRSQILSQWGATVDVEEHERWKVPEQARRLPVTR